MKPVTLGKPSTRKSIRSWSALLMIVLLGLSGCTRAEVLSSISGQDSPTAAATKTTDERATAANTVSAQTLTLEGSGSSAPSPTFVPPTATKPAALTVLATQSPTETLTQQSPASPTPTKTAVPTQTLSPTAEPTAVPPTNTPLPTPEPPPTATPLPTTAPFPTEITVGDAQMLLVPGGEFNMGGSAADIFLECAAYRMGCQEDWFRPSEPLHVVGVDSFYIDAYEVTNASFLAFLEGLDDASSSCRGERCWDPEQSRITNEAGTYQLDQAFAAHPAAGVTWYGAAAYCESRGGRLPTEAEWEKAALWDAATGTKRVYPWGMRFDGQRLNFCDGQCDAPQAAGAFDDGHAETAPVGSYEDGRSPIGAYDMAGNVWEWVSDLFSEDYYSQSIGELNPTGPTKGTSRVVRGGSFFDTGNYASGLLRFPSAPDNADRTIGFRCAAPVPAEP